MMASGCVPDTQDVYPKSSQLALPLPQKVFQKVCDSFQIHLIGFIMDLR